MKKLKLNLEGLVVQSFDTVRGTTEERGTVRGHAPPQSRINDPCNDSRFGGACPISDDDPTCLITQCQQYTSNGKRRRLHEHPSYCLCHSAAHCNSNRFGMNGLFPRRQAKVRIGRVEQQQSASL